ncbi:formyltetrahydrofolate deformylase [Nitzschia inconspicua]|uniref:Formyltetrahydrofolate deformylase n=1 Tax=Nitzschia inconspicua TaxID=303405 RepID=A0A9K3PNB0_9STRA|nr:formyltetrahydrofolate deformylase [Nitzschia inconspicua]
MPFSRRFFSAATARAKPLSLHPSTKKNSRIGTLRVVGTDCRGIVAACTQVLGQYNCNIVKSEHWTDTQKRMFFQRLEFHHPNDDSVDHQACEDELEERLRTIQFSQSFLSQSNLEPTFDAATTQVQGFPLECHWNWRDRRKRVGIMVSKYDHCLWELLLRHSANELDMDIDLVISNHDTLRHVPETFGIPFFVTPITPETKTEQERKQLELLQNVDIVILARYMQVLSPIFLQHFPNRILNIHHSFLPAFSGGSPYHKAYDRGVKLIGATAHYVTEELDDGPIIEQDVMVVSHRDSVQKLKKKGRILERNVLHKALEAHLEDRVIVHENKCVVFGD